MFISQVTHIHVYIKPSIFVRLVSMILDQIKCSIPWFQTYSLRGSPPEVGGSIVYIRKEKTVYKVDTVFYEDTDCL